MFRDGETAESVKEAIDTQSDLIWSITMEPSPESRKRLGQVLPFLLQRLKRGLQELAVPKTERDRFFKMLAEIHLEAIKPPELRQRAAQDVEDEDPEASKDTLDADNKPLVDAEGGAESEPPTASLGDEELVLEAIEAANRIVFETAAEKVQCHGMGSTLVMGWLRPLPAERDVDQARSRHRRATRGRARGRFEGSTDGALVSLSN